MTDSLLIPDSMQLRV